MKCLIHFRFAILLAPIAIVLLAEGCATPPDYPKEPQIEYVGISKNVLERSSDFRADTIRVTFSFTDGDGDLATDTSLFIVDLRNGGTQRYGIPGLPELGSSNGLKGEITTNLYATCCVFSDPFLNGCTDEMASMPFDTINYEIYIVDKAGHESNRIQVEPIYIKCSD